MTGDVYPRKYRLSLEKWGVIALMATSNSPMDNGDSAKEGVGRTYAGVDGYCPLAAYLGTQGYCLQLALRPGTQHSAYESQYNLEHVLPLAARLSSAPLLLRADSGFCSKDLMLAVHSHASALGRTVDYLIKWNPRSTPVEAWAQAKCADEATVWCLLRAGQARLRVAGGCRTGPGRGRSAHWRATIILTGQRQLS
ncbi:transposase [Curvibacter soli]|uniref:transposase n=1 Tax=Curvibacter soli TaxID=3031331 RepID=UPI003AF09CEE